MEKTGKKLGGIVAVVALSAFLSGYCLNEAYAKLTPNTDNTAFYLHQTELAQIELTTCLAKYRDAHNALKTVKIGEGI